MPTVVVQTLRRGRPYAERVLAALQKTFPDLGFSIDPMNGGDSIFALKVSGGTELTTVDVEKVTNHVNLIPFTEPLAEEPSTPARQPTPAPAKDDRLTHVNAPGLETGPTENKSSSKASNN